MGLFYDRPRRQRPEVVTLFQDALLTDPATVGNLVQQRAEELAGQAKDGDDGGFKPLRLLLAFALLLIILAALLFAEYNELDESRTAILALLTTYGGALIGFIVGEAAGSA